MAAAAATAAVDPRAELTVEDRLALLEKTFAHMVAWSERKNMQVTALQARCAALEKALRQPPAEGGE